MGRASFVVVGPSLDDRYDREANCLGEGGHMSVEDAKDGLTTKTRAK
jgi:hypothetical protein